MPCMGRLMPVGGQVALTPEAGDPHSVCKDGLGALPPIIPERQQFLESH